MSGSGALIAGIVVTNGGGWAADSKETETDPKGLAEGTSRLLRGGSCGNGAFHCRSGQRASNPADACFDDWGFRLACPVK